jgi:hypothetical protein
VLKLGVSNRKQFLSLHQRDRLGRLFSVFALERISYTLIRMPTNASKEDVEVFERLMPYIRLSGGTYRTTSRGRFRNLDPEVNRLLAANFDSQAPLEVQDWAASACLTSSEWARSLFAAFPRLRLTASDLLLFLVELQDHERGTFVFEPGGAPLQFVKPPFVARMTPPESWKLPVNRWLSQKAWRRWQELNPLGDRVNEWIISDSEATLRTNGMRFDKLSLVHPEALQLARTDSRFRTSRQSVFEPLHSPVQVIRTMNIFNRAYFSEQQLMTGASAVVNSLLPGGIWVLGRTVREEPPVHEVTIFKKTPLHQLEVVKRLGPGSEIESLVLSSFQA